MGPCLDIATETLRRSAVRLGLKVTAATTNMLATVTLELLNKQHACIIAMSDVEDEVRRREAKPT